MVSLWFTVVFLVLQVICPPFFSPAFSGEAIRIDLESAIKLALEQNLELKAKEAELGVVRGKVTKSNLFLQQNPELEGDMANRRAKEREEGDRRHHTDVEVRLSQEVEIGGQPAYRRAAVQKELEKASWELKDAQEQLRFRVKGLFFSLLALREKGERAKVVVGLRERLHKAAQDRVKVGDAPEMILAQTEFELSRARSELLGLQREYEKNLTEMRVNLNLAADQELTLEGSLKKDGSIADLKGLTELAFLNRADLAAREAERQAAQAEVSLTRAERIPNVKFSVFYSREEGNFNIIGGGISIPLPFFDRKQGELQQALARRSAADIQYRNMRQTVEKTVRSAWERLRSSEAEIDLFGENVLEKFRVNLDLTQKAYEEGQIEIFELITSQERLAEAQTRYLDALLTYHTARAELEREAALGRQGGK